jgi:hypothetical protein
VAAVDSVASRWSAPGGGRSTHWHRVPGPTGGRPGRAGQRHGELGALASNRHNQHPRGVLGRDGEIHQPHTDPRAAARGDRPSPSIHRVAEPRFRTGLDDLPTYERIRPDEWRRYALASAAFVTLRQSNAATRPASPTIGLGARNGPTAHVRIRQVSMTGLSLGSRYFRRGRHHSRVRLDSRSHATELAGSSRTA